MKKPCEYCGCDLPLGVDKDTRRIRSRHFSSCKARPSLEVESPAPVPTSWMEMVTVNLVREGVNKHKARELAEHFYSLSAAQPAPVQPVSGVVLRDGYPTLIQDKHIKETDHRLCILPTTPSAAQPAVQEVRLWDTQWTNVVNHDNAYRGWDKQDAINHAVKMTEQYIATNVLENKCPPAQPAVPDAIHHTDLSEHPQYIEGWNDCRQAMLEMMK